MGFEDGNHQNKTNVILYFSLTLQLSKPFFFASQPEHGINRAELLYQLLSMPGNLGDIPEMLIDLLEI